MSTWMYLVAVPFLAVAIVLILAARQPREFRVARSLPIGASPEKLHGLINDLRRMNTWNPYALRETGGTSAYSGPASGPGATFEFAGKKSGTGHISIVDSTPQQVGLRLVMTKPFNADNRVDFLIDPKGPTTDVTWAMTGKSPLIGRVIAVFFNCDRMMGRDFEEGLANLKRIAEAA